MSLQLQEDVERLVAKLVSVVASDSQPPSPFQSTCTTTSSTGHKSCDNESDDEEKLVTKHAFQNQTKIVAEQGPAIGEMRKAANVSALQTRGVKGQIGYVFSAELIAHVDKLPKVAGRANLIHRLIEAYGLLDHLLVIKPLTVDDSHLRSFHSQEYIDHVKRVDGGGDETDNMEEDFGLNYDCAPFPGIYKSIQSIAGSSLAAAEAVASGLCRVAINWTGGWHHCHRDEASGFCYVNDINLSILHLLKRGFDRVMYIDYDLHHGDGVEAAFAHSSKVLTVSFHKFEVGFFPGTGDLQKVGKRRRHAINVPLRGGITDQRFAYVAEKVLTMAFDCYNPQVIVAQFGADTLVGDPMDGFNLTLQGPGYCLKQLLGLNVPTIVLGGGGYNLVNTARLWTHLTSIAVGVKLENEIPDHEHFLDYRPSYELCIESGLRRDENSDSNLESVLHCVLANLEQIRTS